MSQENPLPPLPACSPTGVQMFTADQMRSARAQVLEVLRELVEAENARRLGVDTIGRLDRAWERARSLINPEA